MTTGIEQLKALVAAGEKLPDKLANVVYDTIPWKGINDAASEAHCDHLYEKCCEAVEAVLADSRASIAAALEVCQRAAELREREEAWVAVDDDDPRWLKLNEDCVGAQVALDAALAKLTSAQGAKEAGC